MSGALFEYYYAIRFGILALFLVCGACAAVFWFVRRRWLRKQQALEQALVDRNTAHFEKLRGDLQRSVSHEYGKGLSYILNKSTETLAGLGSDQTVLREKQAEIIATAEALNQHARNILAVYNPHPQELNKELLDIRQLVESVLLELFPYSESQGVIMRTSLQDLEPIFLDPGLTALAIRNLVHNAIKYSPRGRAVEISLTSEAGTSQSSQAVLLAVKDHGRGIPKDKQARLFTPDWRDDGLIETGSGLGLYLTRMAARLQGGDVILLSSIPNEGSLFQLSLPVATPGEAAAAAKTQVEPARPRRAAWTWGLAIIGVAALVALLYVLFKPPQTGQLITNHSGFGDRYVSALGEQDNWELTQVQTQEACTRFRLIPRGDKVALLTCHDLFVTAPWLANPDPTSDQHPPMWKLRQVSTWGDCGLFELLDRPAHPDHPGNWVALRTCTGMVVTAADGNWPGEMAWALVAETDEIRAWEEFHLAPPQ